MKILIGSIPMPIQHTEKDVLCAAQEIVRRHCVVAKDFSIYKQSLDARRKQNIHYVYSVMATAEEGTVCDGAELRPLEEGSGMELSKEKKLLHRPVVVGMGPCGLFAAYLLAKSGNPPLIIERGQAVEERWQTVQAFWKGGKLNPESNVQFGEGGAGTFSDGKLNTRISDPRQRFVLETFVEHGAPREILYRAKPHIGTDLLRDVVRSMRKEIIRLGGEVRFSTCLTRLRTENGRLCEIELNHSETLPCAQLVLAIGHSSRDTYTMLHEAGISMEPKAFAAGVRVEHDQRMVDAAQYGREVSGLPAADYRLVYNGKERSCYSFCMCPGGMVVNASSEAGCLVVNGMSYHGRDGRNANSALVVSVRPEDFGSRELLAGIEFQRRYEALAYLAGGGDGSAPIQRTRDFVRRCPSTELGKVSPTFTGKWRFAQMDQCLPDFICDYLRQGLDDFERRIPGFTTGDGLLTGVEMRTSAPLRILRNEGLESLSAQGLYPGGEGAGYAGGIVSAAVDGIRIAVAMLEAYGR